MCEPAGAILDARQKFDPDSGVHALAGVADAALGDQLRIAGIIEKREAELAKKIPRCDGTEGELSWNRPDFPAIAEIFKRPRAVPAPSRFMLRLSHV